MPIMLLGGLLQNFANVDIQGFLIRILVLCVSLSFHEMCHAWAAFKLGDDTAALQGRLTLNPLAHLDPIGSLAFLIGGIGWAKPVPINPTRFDRKYSMKKGLVLTSVAGPISNLVLSAISIFIYFVILTIMGAVGASQTDLVFSILLGIFGTMYSANIVLAVFNLLPVPPLDGYKVFGAVLPGSLYYKVMRYEFIIGLVFLLFVYLGRSTYMPAILNIVVWPFDQVIRRPLGLLFSWIWQILGLA
jgi:Zn-dependent protease